MKLARASQAEIDRLMKWLQRLEMAKFEDAAHRPPAFMRVVFGYETLVENCCDKALDYLEFSPELLKAKKDSKRLDDLEKHLGKIVPGSDSAKYWILGQKEFAPNKASNIRAAIDAIDQDSEKPCTS